MGFYRGMELQDMCRHDSIHGSMPRLLQSLQTAQHLLAWQAYTVWLSKASKRKHAQRNLDKVQVGRETRAKEDRPLGLWPCWVM